MNTRQLGLGMCTALVVGNTIGMGIFMQPAALAPFGLGAGNLDIEESAEIMAQVLAEHMKRAAYPSRVVIIAENALVRCGTAALRRVISRW